MEFAHVPVMPREAVEYLGCSPGGVYVDGTVGGGGYAREILKATGPEGRLIGIDRDPQALEAAAKALSSFGDRVVLVHDNFSRVKEIVEELGLGSVDGVVLDLGVSSFQLESAQRGFSFSRDAPLDMRMDPTRGTTARELVNTLSAGELARIFRLYGEERFSKRIAGAIVRAREKKPVETTGELAAIVEGAVPGKFRHQRIHPATRVFQALRIAVNDEMESLEAALAGGMEVLVPGGRMVVISFHSLEDRTVKRAFRDFARGCVCPPDSPKCVCGHKPLARVITRKPVLPAPEEVERNPRARSAKLRAAEKLPA